MTRSKHEQPWMPGPDVPWNWILVNPDGTRHLAFNNGRWLRIYADQAAEPLTAGEAMALRPSDIDTIIRWTVTWCMGGGDGTNRANELIDELASGARTLVVYLLSQRT